LEAVVDGVKQTMLLLYICLLGRNRALLGAAATSQVRARLMIIWLLVHTVGAHNLVSDLPFWYGAHHASYTLLSQSSVAYQYLLSAGQLSFSFRGLPFKNKAEKPVWTQCGVWWLFY
jgi:hypothetical protein